MAQRLLPVAIGILLAAMIGCINNEAAPPSATSECVPQNELVPIEAPVEDLNAVATGNNAFAVDLFHEIRNDPETKGNFVVSPYSISSALAMTYAGARGETAEEIRKTLHFNPADERLHRGFAGLAFRLQSEAKTANEQFRVAKAIWVQQGFNPTEEFRDITTKLYRAGYQDANFAGDPDGSRQVINRWVEVQTEDRIKELIEQGIIDEKTVAVLVNAIYYRGFWQTAFDKKRTVDAPFFVAPEQSVSVKMMTSNPENAKYFEDDAVQVAVLPYKTPGLGLAIVVPKQVDGLAAIEKELSVDTLNRWFGNMSAPEVTVHLPQFKMEFTRRLDKDLQTLGMPLAFDPELADFSGMLQKVHPYIGAVVHKATIDVDEEGTVASAATAAVIKAVSARRVYTVRADRPFLFLLRDDRTGMILFMGRVSEP